LDQLKRLYGPHFPIEVRHYIAGWLESQSWDEIQPDNQYQAQLCYEGMLQALQEVLNEHNTDFLVRTQLEGLFLHMRVTYSNKHVDLVKIIQECLRKEKHLVETMEADMKNPQEPVGPEQQIQKKLDVCKQHTEDLARGQKQLHTMYENLTLKYNEYIRFQSTLQERPTPDRNDQIRYKQQLEAGLRKDIGDYQLRRKDIEVKFKEVLEEVNQVQQQVLEDTLEGWKQKQKNYNMDEPKQNRLLSQMQKWCETLAEMVWMLLQLLKQDEVLQHPPWAQGQNNVSTHPPVLAQMHRFTVQLLVNLVKKSFILERQPPQVLKTANRFTATLRILVGNKLNIHMSPPEVTVSIINEQQAKQVQNEPDKKFDASFSTGEILNCRKLMEVQPPDRLTCVFNNMQLKRIRRCQDRRTNESVMEEKFTLLFQSVLHVGEGINVIVRAMSLPAVVIVHGNQQPQAEFTIFWDNSFSEPNRQPFLTTDVVPWSNLGEALNNYFYQATGKGLTPDNLSFLARKLAPNLGPDDDLSSVKITRQAVGKDIMRGSQFTFWSWFYQARELIVSCLKKEWCAGLIEGFIDKSAAHIKLLKCQSGTFLVRFSEHCCGGVSIAYTKTDLYGPAEVLNVQPWTKSDLHVQPFSNKVRDLPELIYLFPTTPKGDAFGDFYQHHQNPPTTNGMGYIAASIVTVIHSEPNSIAGSMYSPTPPSPYSQRIDSPFSNAPPTPLESQLPLDMQLPRVPGSNPPLPSFDDI
jgi:hypothetical protein